MEFIVVGGSLIVALVGFCSGFVMGRVVERVKHTRNVEGGSLSRSGPDPRPRR